MIRRAPTTIPLTDLDVQQVRDAIAQRKKLAAKQTDGGQTPAQAKVATASTSVAQPYHHVEEAKKKREAMSREERLGLR